MNISRNFILRPVATSLVTVALLIAGIIAYQGLPVADLPNMDMPVILVRAEQAGGSPSEIASTIAAPLEKHLGAIAGLNEMTSQSTTNQTQIALQFDLSRDINGAARDVEAAIQAAREDLPSTLRSNPTYFKINPSAAPIMLLALTSPTRPTRKIYDIASIVLQQQLSQVEGVGRVEVRGGALPAVRVEINPLMLYKYGIGFEDIRAALASANAHTPKGFIDAGGRRFTLDTNDQAIDAQAYRDLIIAYRSSHPIRLSSVADVENSVENVRQMGVYDGQRAIIGIVTAQAGANIVDTVKKIRRRLIFVRKSLPADVDMHVAMDRSRTIKAAITDTKWTLVIAVFLVIAIVLFFLQSFATVLIPAIVVPTSIIATFAVMALLDFQIDIMSLMALTIATGFVVDDAVVVLENVTRHLENGATPLRAALEGAQEVVFTVVSMTFSLVAVFMPVMLLGGIPGRLLHEFSMTISITLIVSMFLSLTTTPMVCALLLRPINSQQPSRRITRLIANFLSGLSKGYSASLEWSFRHRVLMLLTLPGTLFLAGALFIGMPKNFFPQEDNGFLMGSIIGGASDSFTIMSARTMEVTRSIAKDSTVEGVVGVVGGRQSNEANLFVPLVDRAQRKEDILKTVERFTNHFASLIGAKVYFLPPNTVHSGARSGNASYQYTLHGADAEELAEWTPRVARRFERIPGIMDVSTDTDTAGDELDLRIIRDNAARLQITPQLIANTLYDAYGQRAVSVIYRPLNQYRVIMEAAPRFWQDPTTLMQTWVSVSGGTPSGSTSSNNLRVVSSSTSSSSVSQNTTAYKNLQANSLADSSNTSSGAAVSTDAETMIPLMLTSTIKRGTTPTLISHDEQATSTTVFFNLKSGASLDAAIRAINTAMVGMHLPPTIEGSFAGNAQLYQSASGQGVVLIIAALGAVYIVLGMLYESLIHPLTILSTLPSAGAGAIIALRLCGQEFSLIAMVGVLLLIGIVKKNAIILIDFAIQLQRQGKTPLEAVREASHLRFRPILMTSLAAAFGAIPLMIGGGYGSELRYPLGVSIFGGLVVSQALTLYSTPAVYLTLDTFAKRIATVRKKLFVALYHPHRSNHHLG